MEDGPIITPKKVNIEGACGDCLRNLCNKVQQEDYTGQEWTRLRLMSSIRKVFEEGSLKFLLEQIKIANSWPLD